MNRNFKTVGAGMVGAIALLALPQVSQAQPSRLTGAAAFSANGIGGFNGSVLWDTNPNNQFWNLQVTPDGWEGNFLNPVDYPLTLGDHRLTFFGDGLDFFNHFDWYGLNLYLDGKTDQPQITVFSTLARSSEPTTRPFRATGAAIANLNEQTVFASNSLSFTATDTIVTVTDFGWSATTMNERDRVNSAGSGANGNRDMVGYVDLRVTPLPPPDRPEPTPIPEPISLLALLSIGFSMTRLRSATQTANSAPAKTLK